MGAIISYAIISSVISVACTAVSSTCTACLGSSGVHSSGRKRSVLLLTVAIVLALYFQYSIGPSIVQKGKAGSYYYKWIPGLGSRIYNSWYIPCQQYDDKSSKVTPLLLQQCAGNSGVYRPMAVATLFFIVSAVASKIRPTLNREVWPTKFGLFLFGVALSVVMYSWPLYSGVYLWLARVGATIFVLLQQIILIDVAYNWNEDWIDRADQADRLVYGSGNAWLKAVIATCATFYLAAFTGIVILFKYFGQCSDNAWIISLTLLGIIGLTAVQLTSHDGSLLTSSIISLYVSYLAYNMVSKNPNGMCNPQLGTNDVTGIVIGLTLTAISLAWTGWSWTAEERLNPTGVQSAKSMSAVTSNTSNGSVNGINLDVPFLDPGDAPTSGVVMDGSGARTSLDDEADALFGTNSNNGGMAGSEVWKLNVVMALICCYVAMTLTGWGTLSSMSHNDNHDGGMDDHTFYAANPTVGRFNMAMIGISQWCAIGLYVWTLLAPQLFPDREFS